MVIFHSYVNVYQRVIFCQTLGIPEGISHSWPWSKPVGMTFISPMNIAGWEAERLTLLSWAVPKMKPHIDWGIVVYHVFIHYIYGIKSYSTCYHSNHSSNIINIQNQSQKMRMIHPGLLGPLHLDMSRLVSSQPVGFTSEILRETRGTLLSIGSIYRWKERWNGTIAIENLHGRY